MTEREKEEQMTALTRGGLCALGLLGVLIVAVEAGLHTEGNLCGQKRCQANEYCNGHQNMCESCSEVCEKTSNNYQQDTCDRQCQDYLHEKMFIPRASETQAEDLRSVVSRLTVLVTITLVVSVLALVALVTVLALFFWYRKQQNKQSPIYLKSNGVENGKVNYKTEPLKLDVTAIVPPPSTTTAPPPVTPATTSTPLSTRPRYPKEDPTLEYGAYDNPGLTPSPVFDNKPPETTPVNRRQESSF